MQVIPTSIPEVCIIEPKVYADDRGFFMETYQQTVFSQAGIDYSFVQDNHSGSHQGTLRGMHYQIKNVQGKIIRVVSGKIFDAAVDLRKDSPTFGKWVGDYLSAENKRQIWVPPGFAHGFYVISEWAEIIYKTTDFYTPQWERTLLWNDPRVGIKWPLLPDTPLIISPKDLDGNNLAEAEIFDNHHLRG